MSKEKSSHSIGMALFWKLLERFGVQGTQFLVQIILARMLDPEHYGELSMMVIFTTLANVFIQRGFNTALVQNKDVTEEDYSSVFWVSLAAAGSIYALLFVSAPWIADFYEMPGFVAPFRVLCLVLFPGALNAVQLAMVSRKMDFKKVFSSNLAAIVMSGTVGAVLAVAEAGTWALVAQTLLNTTIACAVMWFSIRWRPRLVCNFSRVRVLFSYGWKLLVSGLLDTLYQDLRSLVIGKKYDSGTLAYYNRGKQFPQFVINAVNSTVQSVMLPAMSAEQDNKAKVKALMRNSVAVSSYIIFPVMAGLAGVAEPLVEMLLTEKWLPCVPYMQIYCFTLAFYPIHSCNLQAINAMGRSDVFLKLEILKKSLGIVMLTIAVFCFESPIAIAMTGVISAFTSSFINASPNAKIINYSYVEQMKDILPSFAFSLIMLAGVMTVGVVSVPIIVKLIIQVIVGVIVYVALSIVFRPWPFKLILGMINKKINRI